MVQQIASMKTESAAQALPFTLSASALSVQNETRQTFNNEFLRQSRSNSVPDQGRQSNVYQTAAQRQTASVQKQNALNEQSKSRADEARARRQDKAEKTASSSRASSDNRTGENAPSNAITSTNSTVGNNRGRATLDLEPINNSISNDAFDANKLPGELTLEDPLDQNTVTISPEGQLTAANSNAVVLVQDSQQISSEEVVEQFDYIGYVTQLAEFTGSKSEESSLGSASIDSGLGILANTKNGKSDLPFINTHKIDAESTDLLSKELQGEQNAANALVNIDLSNSQVLTDNTTLSVNLSSEDLQKIIQMQQAQETELSLQDKAKLAQIVDDLIQQFEANSADGPGIAIVSQADKDLLASLLMHPPNRPSLHAENIRDAEKLPAELILGEPVTLNQIEKASDNLTLKNANSVTNSSTAGVNSISAEQKAQMQLNDEQAKAALENLGTRVHAVASELSSESKGSEFVAALQSGVKEFKQQIAQGREPGIDLKAIVAEALAQISGETVSVQQPKIDAVLNQFSAVVNLANAVNLSATQQATQVLGVSDTQLAKEFTLGQIEGTKLANGIQNQSNVLSTTDKAINIFKQEGQQQLAEKVRWMVNSKNAIAEIRLDPPDLGGINIKINLSGDIAQVNFNVQSATAKEALDQAVPRLREMLQDQGIELGESVVQQESQNSQQGESSESGDSFAHSNLAAKDNAQELAEENTSHVLQQRVSGSVLGGIDYYA